MQSLSKIYEGLTAPGNRGALKELAKRENITTEWLRLVLTGKAKDAELVLAAAKFWEELAKQEKATYALADEYVRRAEALLAEREREPVTQ